MERLVIVENGVLKRLPTGFRFEPTDEELVLHYLRKKVMSRPLPAHIIPVIDVCKFDPWNLPGNPEKERYFFSTIEAQYPNVEIPPNCSGYWKPTGADKHVVVNEGYEVIVGKKKTLVFHRGNFPNGVQTDWIMQEYTIPASAAAAAAAIDGTVVNPNKRIKLSENSEVPAAGAAMDSFWVLSKVFRRMNVRMMRHVPIRRNNAVPVPVPGSPESSAITVDASPLIHEPDHEEASSSMNP